MSEKCEILCPFCSAPWSDDNINIYHIECSTMYESGGGNPESCTINITCHSCKRDMYRKDGFRL